MLRVYKKKDKLTIETSLVDDDDDGESV